LLYNNESKSYNGDFIDSRGYYLRKSHYRIEFQPENDTNHPAEPEKLNPNILNDVFVTIFQNGGPVQ